MRPDDATDHMHHAHMIEDWRAGLDMADASRNRTLSALKAALNFAVRSRYLCADARSNGSAWNRMRSTRVVTCTWIAGRDVVLSPEAVALLREQACASEAMAALAL